MESSIPWARQTACHSGRAATTSPSGLSPLSNCTRQGEARASRSRPSGPSFSPQTQRAPDGAFMGVWALCGAGCSVVDGGVSQPRAPSCTRRSPRAVCVSCSTTVPSARIVQRSRCPDGPRSNRISSAIGGPGPTARRVCRAGGPQRSAAHQSARRSVQIESIPSFESPARIHVPSGAQSTLTVPELHSRIASRVRCPRRFATGRRRRAPASRSPSMAANTICSPSGDQSMGRPARTRRPRPSFRRG